MEVTLRSFWGIKNDACKILSRCYGFGCFKQQGYVTFPQDRRINAAAYIEVLDKVAKIWINSACNCKSLNI